MISDYIEERILPDADALAGIAMPAWVSASKSINILTNAEALAGFVPCRPSDWLLEATC